MCETLDVGRRATCDGSSRVGERKQGRVEHARQTRTRPPVCRLPASLCCATQGDGRRGGDRPRRRRGTVEPEKLSSSTTRRWMAVQTWDGTGSSTRDSPGGEGPERIVEALVRQRGHMRDNRSRRAGEAWQKEGWRPVIFMPPAIPRFHERSFM